MGVSAPCGSCLAPRVAAANHRGRHQMFGRLPNSTRSADANGVEILGPPWDEGTLSASENSPLRRLASTDRAQEAAGFEDEAKALALLQANIRRQISKCEAYLMGDSNSPRP